MENQSKKMLLIIFLLLHGIVINFILFPILYLFSEWNNLNYLTLSEWVKSICINLLTWQFLYYISKRNSGNNNIQLIENLKKFPVLVLLHRKILKLFSNAFFRRVMLNATIISIILLNFLFPVIATLFFNFSIDFTYSCIWFITFQLSFLLFYYLQRYFPEDGDDKEYKFQSPWFIDEIIGQFYSSKV